MLGIDGSTIFRHAPTQKDNAPVIVIAPFKIGDLAVKLDCTFSMRLMMRVYSLIVACRKSQSLTTS